jgi:hypothetical protein
VESGFRSILLVYIYSVLGVFLVVAPWTPVWEQASHGLLPQSAHILVLSGWVRGLVSGLGAADLVVAARLAGRMMRAARK